MQKKINPQTDLKNAILLLENNREAEEHLLRKQFHITYESLKPINLIKRTFSDAVASPDLKDNVVNASIGLSLGFLAKKIFVSLSRSPVKKVIGSAIMLSITKVVAKNPEVVKLVGTEILNMIKSKIYKRVKKTNATEAKSWE